jgi:prepilin-type processing-associated H-X9-DG protein
MFNAGAPGNLHGWVLDIKAGLASLERVKMPSSVIWLGEPRRNNGSAYYFYGVTTDSALSPGSAPRHGDVMNCLFLDGHAEARTRNNIPDGPSAAGGDIFWNGKKSE